MKPILKVSDLMVEFHQRKKVTHAIRGVSFEIYPEEIIGIVGESGSGKSVMVKSILKLFSGPSSKLTNGLIEYEGENLLKLSEQRLQKIRGKEIGMIFQDPMTALNPTMKIGHQITESLLQHKIHTSRSHAKIEALRLLSSVGIPDAKSRFSQYPHELSGGLRQRVMIAMALAPSPKILIADEPTTALDVTIQAQILDLLKSLQKQTKNSIVFITHDLSIVANLCTRVLVMYAGEIVENANVYDLFKNPKHPYTKKLLESIPRVDLLEQNEIRPIEGRPPDLSQKIDGCSFFQRCPSALKVCPLKKPPFYQLSEKTQARCWLYHPEIYEGGKNES